MSFKRTVSLFICFVLAAALLLPAGAQAAAGMDNFDARAVSYTRGQFSDINESAWYGFDNQKSVATACGLGLMNGTGSGFSPEGSLTIAQAITMAARIFSIYNGDNHVFEQGTPWYQCYVDYAEDNYIIDKNGFAGQMDRKATRAEMAYILAYALPYDELNKINHVTSLPDVDANDEYFDEICTLYCAGILTGNDAYGTFTPNEPISRAAAAAIVSRLALPELRKSFTLTPVPSSNGAALLDYSHYNAVSKPAKINTYNDFVRAWEWMLVNSVYMERFPSDLLFKSSKLGFYQEAALEAKSVAALNYYDYASFLGKSTIETEYLYNASGDCNDVYFTLILGNADGISNSTVSLQTDAFESTCADIVAGLYESGELNTSMTNKQKAYVLYRYVALNTSYDESYTRYTGYDAAVLHSAVCQGYAGMYSMLCNLAGVPAAAMTGEVGGVSHAWNRVYDNDRWYYIDVTFADPVPDSPGYCDDSWFWLDEATIRTIEGGRSFDSDSYEYINTFSLNTQAADFSEYSPELIESIEYAA